MTSLKELPFMKPFVNLTRIEKCGNEYKLTIFVRLQGYKVTSYDPKRFTYERIGGVNLRHTTLNVEKTGGDDVTEYFDEFRIIPDRRYEDVLYVEVVEPAGDLPDIYQQDEAELKQRSMPVVGEFQYVTRSFMLSGRTAGDVNHGGTGGSYEP